MVRRRRYMRFIECRLVHVLCPFWGQMACVQCVDLAISYTCRTQYGLCDCVCWAHGWTVQKRLNGSRCRLGADSCRPCIRLGLDMPWEGELLIGRHVLARCTVRTFRWVLAAVQRPRWTSAFAAAKVDKPCKVYPDDYNGGCAAAIGDAVLCQMTLVTCLFACSAHSSPCIRPVVKWFLGCHITVMIWCK